MTFPDAIQHCQRYIDAWLPGAMFPSEIAWFLENFARAGCDVLLECGRQDGVSTEAFARYFHGSNVRVISIDFDSDPARAARARERVAPFGAELVSGDIHIEVPRVLRRCADRKVALLQDGPKGWEGLATLLAGALEPNVAMIAQHNLHEGHVTRTLFQMLSIRPSFLEYSTDLERFTPLIDAERTAIRAKSPNRPVDHTSLGVMLTDPLQKKLFAEQFGLLKPLFGPWDPRRVVEAWRRGDFEYVTRLRKRVRFTRARWKAR